MTVFCNVSKFGRPITGFHSSLFLTTKSKRVYLNKDDMLKRSPLPSRPDGPVSLSSSRLWSEWSTEGRGQRSPVVSEGSRRAARAARLHTTVIITWGRIVEVNTSTRLEQKTHPRPHLTAL